VDAHNLRSDAKLQITFAISFMVKERFAYSVKSSEIRFDGMHLF
jgi:hypothetical protein